MAMNDRYLSSFCYFAFEVFDPQPKSVLSVDFQERPAMCSSTNMSVLPNISQPNSMETTGLMFRVRKCWRGLFHHQNVKNVFLVQTIITYYRPNLIQKVNAAKVLKKITHQRAGLQTQCKMGDPESGRISPQKWPEPCPRHSMSIQSW